VKICSETKYNFKNGLQRCVMLWKTRKINLKTLHLSEA